MIPVSHFGLHCDDQLMLCRTCGLGFSQAFCEATFCAPELCSTRLDIPLSWIMISVCSLTHSKSWGCSLLFSWKQASCGCITSLKFWSVYFLDSSLLFFPHHNAVLRLSSASNCKKSCGIGWCVQVQHKHAVCSWNAETTTESRLPLRAQSGHSAATQGEHICSISPSFLKDV